jgi:hypothetical protein
MHLHRCQKAIPHPQATRLFCKVHSLWLWLVGRKSNNVQVVVPRQVIITRTMPAQIFNPQWVDRATYPRCRAELLIHYSAYVRCIRPLTRLSLACETKCLSFTEVSSFYFVCLSRAKNLGLPSYIGLLRWTGQILLYYCNGFILSSFRVL